MLWGVFLSRYCLMPLDFLYLFCYNSNKTCYKPKWGMSTMISEAQQRLAHRIASSGAWTYSGVIKLMEQKSPFVETIKQVANNLLDPYYEANVMYPAGVPTKLQRAYLFARTASDATLRPYGPALLLFLCQSDGPKREQAYMVLKDQLVKQHLWPLSPEKQQEWLAEYDAFMARRIEECQKGDPYAKA